MTSAARRTLAVLALAACALAACANLDDGTTPTCKDAEIGASGSTSGTRDPNGDDCFTACIDQTTGLACAPFVAAAGASGSSGQAGAAGDAGAAGEAGESGAGGSE